MTIKKKSKFLSYVTFKIIHKFCSLQHFLLNFKLSQFSLRKFIKNIEINFSRNWILHFWLTWRFRALSFKEFKWGKLVLTHLQNSYKSQVWNINIEILFVFVPNFMTSFKEMRKILQLALIRWMWSVHKKYLWTNIKDGKMLIKCYAVFIKMAKSNRENFHHLQIEFIHVFCG